MKLFEWDICPRPDLRHGAAGYERLFLRAIAGLGHLRYAGKRLQVVHREISQDFPVDVYARSSKASHKGAVGHALAASCRVDPGNPERPKFALLFTAVTVSIAHGALGRWLGRLGQLTPAAPGTRAAPEEPRAATPAQREANV